MKTDNTRITVYMPDQQTKDDLFSVIQERTGISLSMFLIALSLMPSTILKPDIKAWCEALSLTRKLEAANKGVEARQQKRTSQADNK